MTLSLVPLALLARLPLLGIEQVAAFLTHNDGSDFNHWSHLWSAAGYHTYATTEDAVIPDEEPTAQMTTEPVPTTPYILSTKKLYADSQDIVDDAIDVPEETRRRRKRSTDTDLKNEDINYAGPTPRVQPKEGGSLQVSNFVTNSSDPGKIFTKEIEVP